MNKTISLDELPRHIQNLLRSTWEGDESLVLEENGEPVAVLVPGEAYRKMNPAADDNPFAYQLPTDLLDAYHSLLDKKFFTGLTPEEEVKLSALDQQLDEVEAKQPFIQSMQARMNAEDQEWMRTLEEVIINLQNLRKSR